MNQTATSSSPTASSSSAEAVAAASSKTTNAAAAAAAAVNRSGAATNGNASAGAAVTTSTNGVKLIIKASNQQYEDHIIDCDLLWTVKHLKTQLALVYPSKPPAAEQKLIYSGQLLNDTLLLKDVIRSYKDVYTHNHIFHLVYTPKNAPFLNPTQKPKMNANTAPVSTPSSGNSSTDGLRQRHVAGTTTTAGQTYTSQQQQQQQQQPHQQQAQQHLQYQQLNAQLFAAALNGGAATAAATATTQCPQFDGNNRQNPVAAQLNMQAMATQQAAMYNWMQQVYSQYMDQCIRMSNAAPAAAGLSNISTANVANVANVPVGGASILPPLNPFLQQLPFNAASSANPVIQFPSATAATLVTPPPTSATTESASAAPVSEQSQAPAAQAAAPVQPQQQAEPQQQPRFPNIVQEEQENRDWLDSFFSITRLAIFLTILYFNSSPLRCLLVVIIAGGIYLYHIGVFRLRPERNNNNINRNNNAAAGAEQIRQGVQQVQQAAEQQQLQGGEENPPNNGEIDASATAGNNNEINNATAAATGEQSSNADGTTAATPAAATAENNDSPSAMSFVRTFIVTFFTSLLPETPTL